MKASMRIAAALVSALAMVGTARADVIDFDYSSNIGLDIIPNYGTTDYVTADYHVRSPALVDYGRLQWWTGATFNHGPGGVAMDNRGNPTVGNDENNPSNWGEVSLTVKDPLLYDITLDSFLLCRFTGWTPGGADPLNMKLSVEIYNDGVATQYNYWTLTNNGALKVAPVIPDPKIAAKSIVIRWNYPYNIAIDDINYTVTAVPEPATLAIWLLGLTGLGLVGYRRQRRAVA